MSQDSSRLAITWEEIHQDAKTLADQLSAIAEWDRIVAIVRGGLVPAGLLAQHLNIDRVDTLSLCRETQQVLAPFADSDNLLIVDELVDTGQTIQTIKQHFPKAHVAVLYAKPMGRPLANSYVREFPQDVWLDFPWEQTH